jgi:hypothetical protein
MLKIGSIRWRGKCPRHPSFDPYADGRGAIKGACAKCTALVEIHESHQKMVALMRSFAPPQTVRKKIAVLDLRQTSLFAEE